MTIMHDDLKKSGLVPEDMQAYTLDEAARNTCNVPPTIKGYVIPYFDMNGFRLPFYRTRLFNVNPKYKQPLDSASFVYFPPRFLEVANYSDYIVIVEGEKKAASLMKIGIPACSLGGVDAWRSRTLLLPPDVTFKKVKLRAGERIGAKLPAAFNVDEIHTENLAQGLDELIDYCRMRGKTLIICYDNDTPTGPKFTVQRACASFAYELRLRGLALAKIRQWILPLNRVLYDAYGKIAVDDVVRELGYDEVHGMLDRVMEKNSAFPRHPNIQLYVSKKLQRRMQRTDYMSLSLAVLSDLDANGKRLRFTDTYQLYYFDAMSKRLMRVNWHDRDRSALFMSDFGMHMYNKYGLTPNDGKVMNVLAAQFAGEEPVGEVRPYRVFARKDPYDDFITYQINDAQYVKISNRKNMPIEIKDNGADKILFEAGNVEPVTGTDMLEAYERVDNMKVTPWWDKVLQDTRIIGGDRQRLLTALLYYTSPWLYRWRGTQLPVELVIGESGCGKSTLCTLRLDIVTGKPKLRNAPGDLKDWNAAITNSGALHFTDNVQLNDNGFRNKLSDELCRLVTEPEPTIAMRKYYTETDEITVPISAVFGFTAIKQPFTNPDILQRSLITELGVLGSSEVEYVGDWVKVKMDEFGGRAMWLAHHFKVLHEFFKLVDTKWDPNYKAKSRLINLEQIFMLMSEVLGIQSDWIPDYLVEMTHKNITESDSVFKGLRAFRDYMCGRKDINPYDVEFSLSTISTWCGGNEEYSDVRTLINPRVLAPYFKSNSHKIATIVGIDYLRTLGNKKMYKLIDFSTKK